MSKGLYFGGLAGFVFGVLVSLPNVYVSKDIQKPLNLERKAENYEIADKGRVVFQKLTQTGEHEYTGNINGKQFVYRFKPEENRVEVYLKVRKR